MLTSLVYVESGRGIGGIVGVVGRGGRSQRENRHNQGGLLWTCLQGSASRRNLLADLSLLKPERKKNAKSTHSCVTN